MRKSNIHDQMRKSNIILQNVKTSINVCIYLNNNQMDHEKCSFIYNAFLSSMLPNYLADLYSTVTSFDDSCALVMQLSGSWWYAGCLLGLEKPVLWLWHHPSLVSI